MGLGRRAGPPKKHFALHHHTPHPRVPEFICPDNSFGLEPMSSLSPGGAVDGPGEEVWTPSKQNVNIFTHRTSRSQNSSDMVKVLVRSLCRVSARGVAWVSLGRPV